MAELRVGNGRGSERPPETPGSRALRAMETAVLRVRESRGEPPTRLPRPQKADRPPGVPASPAAHEVATEDPPDDRTPFGLLMSLGAAVAVVVVGILVAVLLLVGGSPSKPTAAGPSASHQTGRASPPSSSSAHPPAFPPTSAAASPTPSTTSPSTTSSSTTSPSTTSPSSLALLAGNAPVVVSLDPAAGSAGQQIVVDGGNFRSATGEIVAAFNGVATSTVCATPSACTVTVPPSSGSSTATVTITTSSGTSNAQTFTYGPGAGNARAR
jgi:hypothetical protein